LPVSHTKTAEGRKFIAMECTGEATLYLGETAGIVRAAPVEWIVMSPELHLGALVIGAKVDFRDPASAYITQVRGYRLEHPQLSTPLGE
jgi:hypothetical protein